MGTPLSLRFSPSEVTLLGLAGGEYLPLPASKGPAFPFLLTLDGDPTSPVICAQEQRCSPKTPETPVSFFVDIQGKKNYAWIAKSGVLSNRLTGKCPASPALWAGSFTLPISGDSTILRYIGYS